MDRGHQRRSAYWVGFQEGQKVPQDCGGHRVDIWGWCSALWVQPTIPREDPLGCFHLQPPDHAKGCRTLRQAPKILFPISEAAP